jgi:hypothetical protein
MNMWSFNGVGFIVAHYGESDQTSGRENRRR